MNIPTWTEFLTACNDKLRARIFGKSHYQLFLHDVEDIQSGKLDYVQVDCGAVASSYNYRAYTAAYGLYRDTDGAIVVFMGQLQCNNRHVSCFYFGGERSYRKDYREALAAGQLLRTEKATILEVNV